MSNLGSLFYSLNIKDMTDADLRRIEQKLQNLGIKVSIDQNHLKQQINQAATGTKVKVDADAGNVASQIRTALSSYKFPIKIIVDKAEAQIAVREALQRAGLQSGFSASDARQYNAESKRIVAEARAQAQIALAQQRLARTNTRAQYGLATAHNAAAAAARSHMGASISLGTAMRGNIRLSGELGAALGAAYSVIALKQFLGKVIEIGGELQKQKMAMTAILGDEGLSGAITQQINQLAIKSPFGVMDLNKYAKQLTAFQIPYNELYDTMKRMADISAATGSEMGRIILAFGQIKSATVLKGTEARQLTEANIPIFKMLSDYYTKVEGQAVSVGEVMDRMSKKEIPFKDVKDVLWELTDAGGKFHNMQEKLSESMQAKWKNLADAIDLMFGDIADKTEGPLIRLAETLTWLTKRWEMFGTAIAYAAAAFGTMRVYSALTSRVFSAGAKDAIKAAANNAILERQNLRLAQSYRTLTDAEKRQLGQSLSLWTTQKRMLQSLTPLQARSLIYSGQLTKADWERLAAMGRLNDGYKRLLVASGLFTKAEMAQIRTVGLLKRTVMGMGVAFRSLGRAMASVLFNPFTIVMTVVSSIASVFQYFNGQAERAEEAAKAVQTATEEAAKNLDKIIRKFSAPADEVSISGLVSGIQEMEEELKNYSKTPTTDLTNSLITQSGEVATLTERYDALREKLIEVNQAEQLASDRGFAKKLEMLSGGSWDDLLTDISDYAKYAEFWSSTEHKNQAYLRGANKSSNKGGDIEELEKELDALYRKLGFDIPTTVKQLTDAEKRAWMSSFEVFISQAENLNQFAKEQILTDFAAKMQYEDYVADKYTDRMLAEMRKKMENFDPQLAKAIRRGGHLNEEMTKKFEDAVKEARAKVVEDFPQFESTLGDLIARMNLPTIAIRASLADTLLDADWKRELDEAYGYEFTSVINEAQTVEEARSSIAKAIQAAKEQAEAADAIVLKIEAKPKDKETESWLDKFGKTWFSQNKLKGQVEEDKAAAEAIIKAGAEGDKITGLDTSTVPNKGNTTGTKKDLFAEAIQERIKLLKEAKSEYEKLAKSMGVEAAFKKLADSSIFKGLEANKYLKKQEIPKTIDEYRKALEDVQKELATKGLKDKKHRELNIEIEKVLLDIEKTEINNAVKIALDKIEKEVERQTKNWQLYKKLNEQTGNKEFAASIAFGLDTKETDYVKMVKSHVEKQAKAYENAQAKTNADYQQKGYTFESLSAIHKAAYDDNATKAQQEAWMNIPESIRKAWEEASKGINDYYTTQKEEALSILKEYQSIKDQIDSIEAKRNAELGKLNAKDEYGNFIFDEKTREAKSKLINTEADWEIFTKSSDYLRFFSDVYGIALSEIERIGDAIQINLNARLQAGLITIEQYGDEMAKVRKQIDTARGVKSNAMTFLTGGIKGYYDKRIKEEEGKLLNSDAYQLALKDQISAQEALDKAKKKGNEAEIAAAEEQLKLANESVKKLSKGRVKLVEDQEQWQSAGDVMSIVSNITGGLLDSFNSIKDMAEAFGADTDSSGWQTVGAALETVDTVTSGISKIIQSFMSGDIGGIISGVVSTITTPFTIWSKLHDKELQRKIEKEQELYNQLGVYIDQIEDRLEYALGSTRQIKDEQAERDLAEYRKQQGQKGGVDADLKNRVEAYTEGGAYGYQRELMNQQLESLQRQLELEQAKKDEDDDSIREYQNQITELEQQIKDFARSTADELYAINIKGWAEEIGNALVDAFAAGEDAAAAFDDAVGEIMRSVLKKLLITNHIEGMMADLDKYLFGDNGEGGVLSDMYLDEFEASEMGKMIHGYKDKFLELEGIYDQLNEATGGLLDETEDAKGLSAGIQGVTEDTADLLASYINAIRAHTANIEQYGKETSDLLRQISESQLSGISLIASKQLEVQSQIAENTLRNAVAAEEIKTLLTRNTQGTNKFHFA